MLNSFGKPTVHRQKVHRNCSVGDTEILDDHPRKIKLQKNLDEDLQQLLLFLVTKLCKGVK
jgi:hypothetical protein